ncbi:DUF551 domain-containing protein [Cronobacter sakazakii]|uniref:DUF551 domain-containing protein n=1 Tax=Cronobacter sakazakii TaxID=28141 RepID=UPI0011B0AFBF|nr:DUF551 domain-containing protein [Cronobacter sakazakii]ELY2484016.1 DUF551 domain-containing protein [Cronobacter sakazakii]ELY2762292.1 DUF551 domain-containing protein [Cronobacter sakazakii]ELY3986064.1 DUF551 domain-containing protein [Cronobacter sakazakii]
MSEISKERAQEIFLGNGPEPTVAEERELARIALDWLALRERAEPVGYADPQAFRNFQAGTANKEWMWAKPGAGLVPVFVEAPPAPVDAGWIACSERMPKIGDEIFYYCEDDGIRDCGIVGSSNFTGRGDPELFVHSEGFDLHLGADITQWMPLPAAPGKEG